MSSIFNKMNNNSTLLCHINQVKTTKTIHNTAIYEKERAKKLLPQTCALFYQELQQQCEQSKLFYLQSQRGHCHH